MAGLHKKGSRPEIYFPNGFFIGRPFLNLRVLIPYFISLRRLQQEMML